MQDTSPNLASPTWLAHPSTLGSISHSCHKTNHDVHKLRAMTIKNPVPLHLHAPLYQAVGCKHTNFPPAREFEYQLPGLQRHMIPRMQEMALSGFQQRPTQLHGFEKQGGGKAGHLMHVRSSCQTRELLTMHRQSACSLM